MRATFLRTGARGLALLATLAIAVGCTKVGGGSSVARHNRTTHAHELRYSDGEDIGGLNPMFFQQSSVAYLADMTMAWLFRYDHENRPVPELATEVPTKRNGDIDAAGTTIRLKLRRNVVWSDGKPFTADDVIFTTNEMNDPRNPVATREGFELVTKMDEPDRYTVIFHLRRPYGLFLPNFFTTGNSQPAILPKHLFPHPGDLSHAAYNALPVGIGPFTFETWQRGVSVTMVRNPTYWRGRPKLDRVIYDIYNNANTLLTQVQTGNVDLYVRTPTNLVGQARAIHGYHVAIGPSYLYEHYDFNLARPALADVTVRRALRLAIDRPEIVGKVMRGNATLGDSFMPPPYPDVPKNVTKTPYDVARANAMLDAAGWQRGADGIRAKHGTRLVLAVALVSGNPFLDQIVELTRAWWGKIGVGLTVKGYLASQLFDPLAGVLRKGNFDVALFAWQDPAVQDFSEIFSCSSIPPGGQNYGRWCDPALTPLLRDFENYYEIEQQGPVLGKIDQRIIAQVPSVVLYWSDQIDTENDDLTGFRPNQVSRFDDMMNVDI